MHVDEQVARVLGRLRHQTDRIAELMKQFNSAEDEEEPGLEARLEVVRYFSDERQERGEHNLFSSALGREAIDFLAATGAYLDVDEYDMTPMPARPTEAQGKEKGPAHRAGPFVHKR
ncbi:DUF4279 domain-containing protein [Streptomyces globisporus]